MLRCIVLCGTFTISVLVDGDLKKVRRKCIRLCFLLLLTRLSTVPCTWYFCVWFSADFFFPVSESPFWVEKVAYGTQYEVINGLTVISRDVHIFLLANGGR